MALQNVRGIFKIGSPIDSYKLLLMQGVFSRPDYSGLFHALLRPFVRDGRIAVTYRCHSLRRTSFVRLSEMESDYFSVRELGVHDVYNLDARFQPDLVIDGGGNIGMFTLRASAALAAAGGAAAKFVICEPVPANVEQIRTHQARLAASPSMSARPTRAASTPISPTATSCKSPYAPWPRSSAPTPSAF
jgi:hypothetical protein